MPTDKYDFSAKESNSPYYLIGALTAAVFPPTEMIAGVRDLAANLIKKKPLATAFEIVGLVPLLGTPELVQDLYSTAKKWTTHASKTAAKTVFDPLSDLILKHLPSETKQRITGLFSDDVTKMPALKNTDLTDADIKRLESKDNGYTRKRMNKMADNGFEGTDIRYLAGRGMSPHDATMLKNKGFSVDDIRTFADKGTDPKRAEQLLNEGFSPGDVRHLVDEGEDLNKVSQLRWQEFSPEEIRHYVDHGDDAYSKGGATLEQVGRLERQQIPKDHIRQYVDRGVSLKLVGVLQEQGWSPKSIKYTISGATTIKDGIDYGISKYDNIVSWCNAPHTPSDKGDTGKICRALPGVSSNSNKDTSIQKNTTSQSRLASSVS